MPTVQAAIVRTVSGLDDSLGVFTLVAVVQTSAQLAYTRLGCSSIQGFYETQSDPAGELAAFRSMQPKQNVSFYHNSAQRKSVGGLLMSRFLLGMR
jgi:EAL domain-containing protein (putative c-di-GMP-specific phosphodiesterase class I)